MIIQLLWIAVCILLIVAILEIYYPKVLDEGFENVMSVGDSAWWATYIPRRGDIGYDPSEEESGYIRDTRYYAGYTDVQRLGVNQDFCRMLTSKSDTKDTFFACALGGTEGLSSVHYRTPSTKQGFELSRDDYMKDEVGYCRILKSDAYTFEARCNPEKDDDFGSRLVVDADPPPDIEELLLFYGGIVFWLRFIDDMVDYAKNLTVVSKGYLTIDEAPPLRLEDHPTARTLEFNGTNQFMRIGDARDLEFGRSVDLQYLRAVAVWVYFEEFTNNAHIFDFGNGAGKDNVWMGILGRGNEDAQMQPQRLNGCLLQNESTVPPIPSGQQLVEETTPKHLMETSAGNVNEYSCVKPEVWGRVMPPVQPFAMPPFKAKTADLIYEIWDSQQRKLHVQIPGVFKLKEWTHVVVTATNSDAARPTLTFYVNGELVNTEVDAWLPQNSSTRFNYIGKSNWMNTLTNDENMDEYFKGQLFDFRGYNQRMSPAKVKETYQWGRQKLGLSTKNL